VCGGFFPQETMGDIYSFSIWWYLLLLALLYRRCCAL